MCIGIPMRVLESAPGEALCEGLGQRRRVDILLVGEVPPGTWLLTFLGQAREIIDEAEARRIGNALQALDLVMQGSAADVTAIDALFADLVDREPPKPPSLLALEATDNENTTEGD